MKMGWSNSMQGKKVLIRPTAMVLLPAFMPVSYGRLFSVLTIWGSCLIFGGLTTAGGALSFAAEGQLPWSVLMWGQAAGSPPGTLATAEFQAALQAQNIGSYDTAAHAWRTFIANYPQDARLAEAYFHLGFCEYRLERFAEAAAAYAEAMKRSQDPSLREEAMFYRGVSLLRCVERGQADQAQPALEIFEQFLKTFPNSPSRANAYYCRGELLYLLGKKEEAAASYQEALKGQLTPALQSATRYGLGVCFQELGRQKEAIEQFERFLRDYPSDPLAADVASRLGDLFYAQKLFDAARGYFEQALKTEDAELASYAMLRLADTLASAGQLPEAVRVYQKVQAQFPQGKYAQPAALAAGKILRRLQKWEEAIAELAKVAGTGSPQAEEAAVLLAQSYLDAGQFASALKQAEGLLGQIKTPDLVEQLELIRAEALAAAGDKKLDAYQMLSLLAERNTATPAGLTACFRAASVAIELGRPQEALKYAARFLERASGDHRAPSAQFLIGEAYFALRQLDEAEKAYKTVIDRYPGDRTRVDAARVRLLWISLLRGKHADVISQAPQVASALNTPSLVAEAYYVLGASYFEQKQYRESVGALDQALKADPRFGRAGEARLLLAEALLGLNQPERAREVLQAIGASGSDPSVAQEAEFLLGKIDAQAGRRSEAIARYQALLRQKLSPDLATRVAHALATTLAEENRLAEALPLVDQLLQTTSDPGHLLALRMTRARILWSVKNFADAAATLEEVLKGEPPDPPASEAKYLLALAQLELRNYSAAIRLLEELRGKAARGVDEEEVLYHLAWAYRLNGDEEKAKTLLLEFAKTKADTAKLDLLQQVAELLYGYKEFRIASQAFLKVAERARSENRRDILEIASNRYGLCQFELGEFARAITFFQYQLQVAPQGKLAWNARLMLAESAIRQASKLTETSGVISLVDQTVLPEEARKLYELALEQCRLASLQLEQFPSPDHGALVLLRGGEAAAQLGQWQESVRFLESCREMFPNSRFQAEVLCQLGWAYWKLGRKEEAENILKQAGSLGQSEGSARARFLLGEISFEKKDYKEAIRQFLVVAYGFPFPELQLASVYEAARCYEAMGRTDEAIKLYQEIVKNFGNVPDPKVAVARKKIEGSSPAGSPQRK